MNRPDRTKFQMDKCLAQESRIPVSFLYDILWYDKVTGSLYWLPRENRNFNSKYAWTKCGAVHVRSGAIQIQITYEGVSRLFWEHRIIWAMCKGRWPAGLIDHEDGNNQNNRIENLREADGSGNGMNRILVTGKVPYKGVYFSESRGKFAAQIKAYGRWRWLGLHDDAESAARAYDEAAEKLHGAFAKTNKDIGLL